MKIDHIEDILRCSFGLWISGLFSAISGWNSGITFQEQREAFFGLLEQLLNEGKIKFCPPNEFFGVRDTMCGMLMQIRFWSI